MLTFFTDIESNKEFTITASSSSGVEAVYDKQTPLFYNHYKVVFDIDLQSGIWEVKLLNGNEILSELVITINDGFDINYKELDCNDIVRLQLISNINYNELNINNNYNYKECDNNCLEIIDYIELNYELHFKLL